MEYFDIDKSYEELVGRYPNHKPHPVIGIIGNYGDKGSELADGYFRSIECAGGLPLVIPPTENCAQLCSLFDRIDGLLISGGADLNPLFFGEEPMAQLGSVNPERDFMELMAVRLAYDRNLPIFGICRGMQALNVWCGGTLHNFIPGHQLPQGDMIHPTRAADLMERLLGSAPAVTSNHHQAIAELGHDLTAIQWAHDGTVEAVRHNFLPIWGVQWHPERQSYALRRGDAADAAPLFDYFRSQMR